MAGMTPPPSFGCNIIGYLTADVGNGVVARNLLELLGKAGIPVAGLDIDPGFGRAGRDGRAVPSLVRQASDLPHPVTLWVMPLAAVPPTLSNRPELLDLLARPGSVHVSVPMWELPVLPAPWVTTSELFDGLLALSDFIADTLRRHVQVPVIDGRMPLQMPEDITPDRARFGLAPDEVVFILSFDPHSDPSRKNPFAAIDAFDRAFGPSPVKERLVIKVNQPKASGVSHPVLNDLRARCAGRPGFRILDENLTYPETMQLYASCDVLVSLHRSEGLGLGPMEAMALGKPVVATAWSGNMSFMDASNSCLVGYDFLPVSATLPDYQLSVIGRGVEWAEPRVSEAVDLMRQLARSGELRATIGAAARAAMQQYQAEALKATFVGALCGLARAAASGSEAWSANEAIRRAQLAIIARTVPNPAMQAIRQWLHRWVLWRLPARRAVRRV